MVVHVTQHEFGISTHVLSNKKQKTVTSKFDVLGLSTTKAVSQFDIKTETGIDSSKGEMPVVGSNALWVFLDAKRKRPFECADLKRISDVGNVAEGLGLEHPNLSPQRDQ